MNLEDVEQKSLNYLKQVSNPIVPVRTLWNHIRQEEKMAILTENDLLDFLRKHDLVRIIETPFNTNDEKLSEQNFIPGPRVILRTRIPTQTEMNKLIEEQMDRLIQSLTRAKEEAENIKDNAMFDKMQEVLSRAETLRGKMGMLLDQK